MSARSAKTLSAAVLAAAAALLCGVSHAEWQNALKPKAKPAGGGGVKVVERGKPVGGIRLPARPTPQEKKAAEELQRWIGEMTGATLPVRTGKSAAKCCISIRTDPSLGQEGYRIAVRNGQALLWGGTKRGAVNAVYALLEEDLGCRFYTSDSIRLPKSETLVLAPAARRVVPKLKLRDPYYKCAFDPVWSLRNRTNSPAAEVPEEYGGHVDYADMFVHTAAQLVPPDKYFKTHPEYFALQPDGARSSAALCATHPEVAGIAVARVLKTLKEHPHAEILSVSKNDCQTVCHCERCKKLREAEGSDMANQLCLVNRVAKAVEKDYLGVTIDTLAYLETIQPPKTLRPRKNVAIRLCNDLAGSWSRPFTPASQCETAKLLRAWSAVHKRIHIWDYNVNFEHYLAPMPNLDVIASNIRFWAQNHAEAVMLQGGYQGPAEQDELKCWVAAKLLWDPSLDEKMLAKDFTWGHYAKAAPAMDAYLALLDQMRSDHAQAMAAPAGGIRYGMDAPFFTKDFATSAALLFKQAKELAAGDEALLGRVERAELPLLYMRCVRGPEFCAAAGEYAHAVGEFERIARREKVEFLKEGDANFEKELAGYKSRLAQPAPQ